MKKIVMPDKLSKKARRKYYAERRHTWGELNPVTRSVPAERPTTARRKKKEPAESSEVEMSITAGLFYTDSAKSLTWGVL